MPSLCNSTMSSTPGRDDSKYWSSFSERPFSCGDRLQLYKGRLNGKGPRKGDFAVVKMFSDSPGTQTRCLAEVAKSEACSHWLAHFLSHVGCRPHSVRLTKLLAAPVDQVSVLNKALAGRSRRTPIGGEWVLVEEMIGRGKEDTLVRFVDKQGRVFRDGAILDRPQSSKYSDLEDEEADAVVSGTSWDFSTSPSFFSSGWSSRSRAGSCSDQVSASHSAPIPISVSDSFSSSVSGAQRSGRGCASSSTPSFSCSADLRDLVEAFVHFVHQTSGGRMVVCGLEGLAGEERDEAAGRGLILKTPVIHSCHEAYGETDRGPRGVRDVMKNHVCNRYCRRVLDAGIPSSSSSSLSSISSSGSIPRHSPLPSAPYDPQVMVASVCDDHATHSSPPRCVAQDRGDVVLRGGSSAGLRLTTSPPSYEELEVRCVVPRPTDIPEEQRTMFYLELEPTCPLSPPPPYAEFT